MSYIVSCAGHRWLIERRVTGTKQVSTVGRLPPDPPPLSFLDSSSALSPWTSYQYRLVLHNRAGNTTGEIITMFLTDQDVSMFSLTLSSISLTTCCCILAGPWVNVTTRPSRPAGLSPPRVKVLGPESLQVWALFDLAWGHKSSKIWRQKTNIIRVSPTLSITISPITFNKKLRI